MPYEENYVSMFGTNFFSAIFKDGFIAFCEVACPYFSKGRDIACKSWVGPFLPGLALPGRILRFEVFLVNSLTGVGGHVTSLATMGCLALGDIFGLPKVGEYSSF